MSKFDPLEEAKITDDKSEEKGLSKKKKKKAEADKAAAAAPPPPAPPAQPTAPAAPKRAAAPVFDAKKKYRVLEDKMTSINGRMTKLRKGKVLEARFYGGPLKLQRIIESGVKVEEC